MTRLKEYKLKSTLICTIDLSYYIDSSNSYPEINIYSVQNGWEDLIGYISPEPSSESGFVTKAFDDLLYKELSLEDSIKYLGERFNIVFSEDLKEEYERIYIVHKLNNFKLRD